MPERTVLFVDDEPHILQALRRLLRKESYAILSAEDSDEGMELLAENDVQLVIADHKMPQMTGVQFLQKVKELYPDTIRVILSGYADVGLIVDSINKGEVYRFIGKPWNDEELKAVIRQCLEQYDILLKNRELLSQIQKQNDELLVMNEQLEEIVEQRTRSLMFSQEVLERLPIAVLGISLQGELMLSNTFARDEFTELQTVMPGTDLAAVIPPAAAAEVVAEIFGNNSAGPLKFIWNGVRVQAKIAPLGERGAERGCIMMLEKV